MKFCISNLAWNKRENARIIKLLNQNKISLLEYAPTLILHRFNSQKEISKTKRFWKRNKLKLYSMQSILYEVDNTFIFGNTDQRKNFFNEVKKKIILAKKLGSKIIVFGSPKTKNTFGKKKQEMDHLFYLMFKKISFFAQKNKVIFCIEANPKIYNTKFLTHTKHAIYFVKKINNRFLRVNLDLGTIIYNKENLEDLLKYKHLIGHAQISSPGLRNLLRYKKQIINFLDKLKKFNYNRIVSIESLRTKSNNYKRIKDILKIVN